MEDKEKLLKLAKIRQEMEKARLRHNRFAFRDLKKCYDKLIKEIKRDYTNLIKIKEHL